MSEGLEFAAGDAAELVLAAAFALRAGQALPSPTTPAGAMILAAVREMATRVEHRPAPSEHAVGAAVATLDFVADGLADALEAERAMRERGVSQLQ